MIKVETMDGATVLINHNFVVSVEAVRGSTNYLAIHTTDGRTICTRRMTLSDWEAAVRAEHDIQG